MQEKQLKIDKTSHWYKNCKRQRKTHAKICDECPFRSAMIESTEILDSKENAQAFLVSTGIYTKKGKLTKEYR